MAPLSLDALAGASSLPTRVSQYDANVKLAGDIRMLANFLHLMKNERAATAIEYALLVSLISVAATISLKAVGINVFSVLSNIANAMT
jgi:Flp pilus assembly pilin Flp